MTSAIDQKNVPSKTQNDAPKQNVFRDVQIQETGGDKLSRTYTTKQVISRIWKNHIGPHINLVIISMIAMAITAATTGAIPYLLQQATDKIFVGKMSHLVTPLALIVALVTIVKTIAEYIRNVAMAYLGQRFVADIRLAMIEKLTYGDLAWIENTPSGQLISAFLNDAMVVQQTASRLIVALGENLFKVLVLGAVMFWLDWRMALFIMIFMPIGVFLMSRQRRKMHKSATKTMQETGGLSSLVIQILRSIRAVRAYGQEEREIKQAKTVIDRAMEFSMRSQRARALSSPIVELLTGLGFAAAIYFGTREGLSGALSIGAFSGFMASALLIYQPLKALATLQTALQEGVAAASRVFGVIDQPRLLTQAPDATPLTVTKGRLDFKNIHFHYENDDDGEDHKNENVFDGLNLTIPAGKTVALVGPSGSGKSSLMNLVLRFFDPQEGQVLIDGQDVKQVTSQSLRDAIALVTQEPLLFDDTIEANIHYGSKHASFEEIQSAAKAAAAHDFIMNFPNGYQSNVGEAGSNLSGGEKQRIAIARAILKDAPILLLDEPTSALDSQSEAHFQDALETLMDGRTVLMIAHRLSTVKKADLILVLSGGVIVEEGTHESLMQSNGLYCKLYQTQFED